MSSPMPIRRFKRSASLSHSLIMAAAAPLSPPNHHPDGPAEEEDDYDTQRQLQRRGPRPRGQYVDVVAPPAAVEDQETDFHARTLFAILSSPQKRPSGGLKVKVKAGFLGGSTPEWGIAHRHDPKQPLYSTVSTSTTSSSLHASASLERSSTSITTTTTTTTSKGVGPGIPQLQCLVAFPGVELMRATGERNRTAAVRTKYGSAVSSSTWRYHMPCTLVLHHLRDEDNDAGAGAGYRRLVMVTHTTGQVLVVSEARSRGDTSTTAEDGFVLSLWRVGHHSDLAKLINNNDDRQGKRVIDVLLEEHVDRLWEQLRQDQPSRADDAESTSLGTSPIRRRSVPSDDHPPSTP